MINQGHAAHISKAHANDRIIMSGKIESRWPFVHNWYGFGITRLAHKVSRADCKPKCRRPNPLP